MIQPYFSLSTSFNYDVKTIEGASISHFYSFTADHSNGLVMVVPDASIDILFLCDGAQSKARLCGSTTSARLVEIQRNKRYFGVRFHSGYIPSFITLAPKVLIDAEFPLQEIIMDADLLLKNIAQSADFDTQVEQFLMHFQQNFTHKSSELAMQFRAMLIENYGGIAIADLEEKLGYSSRYICKVFMESFGLSPKSYALIVRFQHALQRMINEEAVSLTTLASEQGYADQSHFFREFKRFTSQAPSRFIQHINHQYQLKGGAINHEILALQGAD